jgi:type I restriction enzyme S subunit
MKKYDSYKDSGVEWIGEIPSHWHIKRLKNIGSLYSGLSGKSGSDFEKVPTENFKPFINFTNIANNKYIVGDNFGFVKINENENQNQVKKNDLFFLMSSENQEDVGKSALLLNDYDELYLNSFCKGFRLTINSDARFINYLLTSSTLSQLISLEGRGFTRINLRMEGVENLPIILPQSIEEQTTIANYLDLKTTQIDDLIAKKELLIQLLEEERTAMINQAVTKGLDPTIPMKDSGIEWLGEIPEHWEVILFKRVIQKIKDGTHGTYQRTPDGHPFLSAKNVYNDGLRISESESYISDTDYYDITKNGFPTKNDLLITCVGTIGRTLVYDLDKPFAFQRSVTFIRFNEGINPHYYKFYVESSVYQDLLISLAKTSAQSGIYMNDLMNTLALKISKKEQDGIVEFLDFKTKDIEIVIAKTQQEIELLKEYKTALISEVVTGKVDVRDEILNKQVAI